MIDCIAAIRKETIASIRAQKRSGARPTCEALQQGDFARSRHSRHRKQSWTYSITARGADWRDTTIYPGYNTPNMDLHWV